MQNCIKPWNCAPVVVKKRTSGGKKTSLLQVGFRKTVSVNYVIRRFRLISKIKTCGVVGKVGARKN